MKLATIILIIIFVFFFEMLPTPRPCVEETPTRMTDDEMTDLNDQKLAGKLGD
jgi:hypothetical protein